MPMAPFVCASDGVIDKRIVANLMRGELEYCSIAGTDLEGLHAVQSIRDVAASTDHSDYRPYNVKAGSAIRTGVNKEDAHRLVDLYLDRMVGVFFDHTVEDHEVRPLTHHPFAITGHHSLMVRVAVELALLEHYLLGLWPSGFGSTIIIPYMPFAI
jgi:hypothetical protein